MLSEKDKALSQEARPRRPAGPDARTVGKACRSPLRVTPAGHVGGGCPSGRRLHLRHRAVPGRDLYSLLNRPLVSCRGFYLHAPGPYKGEYAGGHLLLHFLALAICGLTLFMAYIGPVADFPDVGAGPPIPGSLVVGRPASTI